MTSVNKCVLCDKPLKKIISNHVRDSKKYKVIQCSKCEHVQLNPIPSKEDDKSFYDNNLQEKNVKNISSIKNNRKKSAYDTRRRVELVSKITPKNGKILEIGSGYGFFLEKMKNIGYDITGIEVSNERQKISRRITKSKVLDVNILDTNLKIGKFHTIVLFHVLEHISDLGCFLKNIKKMLRKNGKLVIEVPNFDDYQIKINQKYKEWNFQRAHIHYFTPKIMKYTLEKNNFKNIKIFGIQRYGLGNMFNWKINGKPQLLNPIYEFEKGYQKIDKNYKDFLEKNQISDTIIAIVNKNS